MLLLAIAGLQTSITKQKSTLQTLENMSYLPQSDKLKPFLCGFHTTYAAFLWIKTILYFGGNTQLGTAVPWLPHMVDVVTKLNPEFFPPYEFAGLMLTQYAQDPKGALIILARGGAHLNKDRWKAYYYMSWIYNTWYHDTLRAADCLSMAAKVDPKQREYIISLAAKFYSRSNEKEKAIQFLTSMYDIAESPSVKRAIIDRLNKLTTQGKL